MFFKEIQCCQFSEIQVHQNPIYQNNQESVNNKFPKLEISIKYKLFKLIKNLNARYNSIRYWVTKIYIQKKLLSCMSCLFTLAAMWDFWLASSLSSYNAICFPAIYISEKCFSPFYSSEWNFNYLAQIFFFWISLELMVERAMSLIDTWFGSDVT